METNKYLLTIFLLSIIIVVSYNINNNNIHKIEYDIDNIKTIKYITNYILRVAYFLTFVKLLDLDQEMVAEGIL